MYDCVYPTRTARFGNALVPEGSLALKNKSFADDYQPIDAHCTCSTCRNYTRAYLHTVATNEAVASSLITVHNVAYQLDLMRSIQLSIKEDRFPAFVQKFFSIRHPDGHYPEWVIQALDKVNITLLHNSDSQSNKLDIAGSDHIGQDGIKV
ncbi:hypothetical protein DPMN_153027 [Dreissena polymorpha]|nr:hypothetical protein DPMN_153027 [Dreissena polymorpha]